MNRDRPIGFVECGDGAWILNCRSTLPLTIYGIDELTALTLRAALDGCANDSLPEAIRCALPFVSDKGARCNEVDAYIAEHAQAYRNDELEVCAGCDLEALFNESGNDHDKQVAHLIAATYLSGVSHYREIREAVESRVVSGWRILASADACDCCQRAAERAYPRDNPPRVPVHVGCQCTIAATVAETSADR